MNQDEGRAPNEIQIKAIIRYYLTTVRMTIIKKDKK